MTLAGSAGVAVAAYTMLEKGKPKQLKSPLDPEKFVDFKLKKVEPYNHNTSRYVVFEPLNANMTD
jgi:cytochrome-b5 reductase